MCPPGPDELNQAAASDDRCRCQARLPPGGDDYEGITGHEAYRDDPNPYQPICITRLGGSAQEAKYLFAAVRPAVDRLCATWAASTAAARGTSKAEPLRVPRQAPGPDLKPRKELTRSG